MADISKLPTYPEATRDRVLQQRGDIVQRLRDTADRIERAKIFTGSATPHSAFAAEIVGHLHSMVPNMPIYGFITAATEADVARREDQS